MQPWKDLWLSLVEWCAKSLLEHRLPGSQDANRQRIVIVGGISSAHFTSRATRSLTAYLKAVRQ